MYQKMLKFLPLLNLYGVYRKQRRAVPTIHQLLRRTRPSPKEYVQTSNLNQCQLMAIKHEQYVTIEIPQSLIKESIHNDYTHFHWEVGWLMLTYHGRKGCPITARLGLLDIRVLECQHAVIGFVFTTLNVGTIKLTFYPNFVMSLTDPNLSTSLKIQIQIQGVQHVASSHIATLHPHVC